MNATIIASAFKGHRTPEHNLVNHKASQTSLDSLGLSYKTVTGCYEGNQETSSMITCRTTQDVEAVKNLFFIWYRQDCVMIIIDGLACLVFADRSETLLGEFREVSAAVAGDNYTLIDGKYFQALEPQPSWGDCSQSTKDAEPEALHDVDKPQYNQDATYKCPSEPCSMPFEGRRGAKS